MRNIIKKILREQFDSVYLKRVSKRLEPPYFYNMIEQFGVTNPNDQNEVLKYIYGVDIKILKERKNITIYSVHSSTGLEFYYEDTTGYWSKKEYDSNGNNIYYINHFYNLKGNFFYDRFRSLMIELTTTVLGLSCWYLQIYGKFNASYPLLMLLSYL